MSCGSFFHRSHIVSLPVPALTEGVLNTNIILHFVDWLLSHFVYMLYVFRLKHKNLRRSLRFKCEMYKLYDKTSSLATEKAPAGPFSG
jgi:hypothetical protein